VEATAVGMDYVPVSSRTISMVGFESESLTLGVVFANGTEYHYFNVTQDIFDGFLSASSPGRFLDASVKKAGYSYARMR
jgi:hypothetical protein